MRRPLTIVVLTVLTAALAACSSPTAPQSGLTPNARANGITVGSST